MFLLKKENRWTADTQRSRACAGLCMQSCAYCEARGDLLRCARCKLVSYCSKKCQTADWKLHKKSCCPAHSGAKTLHHHAEDVPFNVPEPSDRLAGHELRMTNMISSFLLNSVMSHADLVELGFTEREAISDFPSEIQASTDWKTCNMSNQHRKEAALIMQQGREIIEVHPWFSIPLYFTGTPREIYESMQSELAFRLNSNDQGIWDWYFSQSTQVGHVYTKRPQVRYSAEVRQSYANALHAAESMQMGKTHVAVGFVDLSVLAYHPIVDSDGCSISVERIESGQVASNTPMCFLGVEASSYQVAKTLVVWEMIKMEHPVDSIVQVWYSSTWHKDTLAHFKAAANALLENPGTRMTSSTRAYLEFWADANSTPMDLHQVRGLWLCKLDHSKALNLTAVKRKQDRVAIGIYSLTGDFAVAQDSDLVGSLSMWTVPDGSPKIDHDEHALYALSPALMANERGQSPSFSIMEAALAVARNGVKRLRLLHRHKLVDVRLLHEAISSSTAPEVIRQIADAHAFSMSWSNVPDYMHPADLHALARKLSARGDCVHFAYSMNWTASVFGTNLMDYVRLGKQKFLPLLKMAFHLSRTIRALSPLRDAFLAIPFTNERNVTDAFFKSQNFEQWIDKWMFKPSFCGGPVQIVRDGVRASEPYPLGRISSVLCFAWTYDMEVSFQCVESKGTCPSTEEVSWLVEQMQKLQHLSKC